MVRDRLPMLIQIRRNSFPNNHETIQIQNIPHEEYEVHILSFLKQMDFLYEQLGKLDDDLIKTKMIHSKILLSPVADEIESKELDGLSEKIKNISTSIRLSLKDIQRKIQNEQSSGNRLFCRIMRTHHSAIVIIFTNTMNAYQQEQADYRDRCKKRIKREFYLNGTYLEESEIDRLIEDGKLATVSHGLFDSSSESAKKHLADIEARHNDILSLQTTMIELHELFLEIALMVEDQGETIDRIENNIEKSAKHVSSAKDNLISARKHQVSANKTKCKILIGVIILVITISIFLSLAIISSIEE